MAKQDQKQKLLEILLKDIPEAADVEILFLLIPNIKDTKTYTYTLPIVELRLASILYTFSDEMSILKKYNFDEKIIDDVHFLIQHLFFQIEPQDISIFNLLKTLPEHLIHLLFSLKRAYALSQQHFEEIHSIDSTEVYVKSFIQKRKNITIEQLNIQEEELIELGFKKNEIQYFLNKILNLVQKNKIENQHQILLNYAFKVKGEGIDEKN